MNLDTPASDGIDQSVQLMWVAPSWPCTAMTAPMDCHTEVDRCAPTHHLSATDPSLNSIPSATGPVPLTPETSVSR
jgi:hypothetical protein